MANLKERIKTEPIGAIAVVAIPVLAVFGLRMGSFWSSAPLVLVAGLAWFTLMWLLRRPKTMRRGLFLSRRTQLAEQHGLKPQEIEAYLDVAADT